MKKTMQNNIFTKKCEKFIDKYNAVQSIGVNFKVPYEVWAIFPEGMQSITIMGDQVSLGGDYCDVERVRQAVGWLVEQLGGTTHNLWKTEIVKSKEQV